MESKTIRCPMRRILTSSSEKIMTNLHHASSLGNVASLCYCSTLVFLSKVVNFRNVSANKTFPILLFLHYSWDCLSSKIKNPCTKQTGHHPPSGSFVPCLYVLWAWVRTCSKGEGSFNQLLLVVQFMIALRNSFSRFCHLRGTWVVIDKRMRRKMQQ